MILHNLHTHQTIQSTLVPYMEASACSTSSFLSPSVCIELSFPKVIKAFYLHMKAPEVSYSTMSHLRDPQIRPHRTQDMICLFLMIKLIFSVGKAKITNKRQV